MWSTSARVVVTDAAVLGAARGLVRAHLAAVDMACSRFRADSEVRALARSAGQPVGVSALLAEHVRAALIAARETGGDVDPTVGAAMNGLGYDRDFSLLLPAASNRQPHKMIQAHAAHDHASQDQVAHGQAAQDQAAHGQAAQDKAARREAGQNEAGQNEAVRREADEPDVSRVRVVAAVRADWTAIALHDQVLTVPAGVLLDLGATAKALAADHCAALVADRFGCGVLVSLGGDMATAGPAPADGWQVLVEDRPGEPRSRIMLPEGAGLATSSTLRRRWWRGGSLVHHIVDPRTGVAADPAWRTVSVAASSCLAANVAATAAIVRGTDAVAGLRGSGLPARLVRRDGRVLALGGWPEGDSGGRPEREL
ncbi:FAD:protein FMN transferase [Nocardia sp. NPDC059240]|uniref:FAD:protein FMN transferase n=1 Tax=Nocardia sp. NPDC059240 TaxID=3346786 RepID=UPI0036751A25